MIALLGSGKTGSYVRELSNHLEWRIFNSKNTPEYDSLIECEALIVFVPAPVLEQYSPFNQNRHPNNLWNYGVRVSQRLCRSD